MANKDLGSASVGVEIDLKALDGQTKQAANMIGNVGKQAEKQTGRTGGKGGLLGQILGGTDKAGFNLSMLSNFSGTLGRVGTAASGTSRVLAGVGAAAAGGAAAFTGIGLAITAVVAVIGGAILAFKGLQAATQFAFSTLVSAGNLQQTETTFEVLRKNMGVSTKVTEQFGDALEKLNYVGAEQTQIMSGLLQSNVGLNDTTLQAVQSMRDLSVAAGVSSTEGINTMNQAITTLNPQLLQNYGITQTATQVFDNYGSTIGQTASTMTDAEKRQAILSAVIAQGARSAGAADAAQGNLNRTVTQLKANFETLKAGLGQVFLPLASGILSVINKEIFGMSKFVDENRGKFESMGQALASKVVPMVQTFIQWIKNIPWVGIIDGIYRVVTGFGLLGKIVMIPAKLIWAAFRIVGQVLATVFVAVERVGAGFATLGKIAAAAWSALTGQSSIGDFVSNVNSALSSYGKETMNVIGATADSWGDLFGDLGSDAVGTIDGIIDAVGKLGKGFDIGKWFNELPSGMKEAGDEALKEAAKTGGGMTAEGRKALKKMQDELAKENADFARSQAKALKDYQEQLAELVANHRDQISDIRKNIAKEQKAYEKSYQERTKAYQDELAKINRDDDDRKKDVQTQIAEELAKGRFADQAKLASLRSRLAYEDAEHKKAVEAANESYQEDTENAKISYDERMTELKTQLAAELAIQAKHGADFAKYRDYQIKDDITKLKQQYAERKAEDTRAHQERLANIVKQGTEDAAQANANGRQQGISAMNGLSAGMSSKIGEINNLGDKIGKGVGDKTGQGVSSKKQKVGGDLNGMLAGAAAGAAIGSIFGPVGALVGGVIGAKIGSSGKAIGQALKDMFNNAVNFLKSGWDFGKKLLSTVGKAIGDALGSVGGAFKKAWTGIGLPAFATGGIVGGRHGTDNNLAQVSRGEMILNRDQQQRMFNMLDGRPGSSPTGGAGGIIIENLSIALPNVRNATQFERELKQYIGNLRTA